MKEKFRIFARALITRQKAGEGNQISTNVSLVYAPVRVLENQQVISTAITITVGESVLVILPDGTWEILP